MKQQGAENRQEQRDALRLLNDEMTQELLVMAERHNLKSQLTSEEGDYASNASDTLSDDERLMQPDKHYNKLLSDEALKPTMPKKVPQKGSEKQEDQKTHKREGSDSGVTFSEIGSGHDLMATFDS